MLQICVFNLKMIQIFPPCWPHSQGRGWRGRMREERGGGGRGWEKMAPEWIIILLMSTSGHLLNAVLENSQHLYNVILYGLPMGFCMIWVLTLLTRWTWIVFGKLERVIPLQQILPVLSSPLSKVHLFVAPNYSSLYHLTQWCNFQFVLNLGIMIMRKCQNPSLNCEDMGVARG